MPLALASSGPTTAVAFAAVTSLVAAIAVAGARRTQTADCYYTAGRSVGAFRNGLALAGDYLGAGTFLGLVGLVALQGFDGVVYAVGLLAGWPIVLHVFAGPVRALGRYTLADVAAAGDERVATRAAGAVGTLAVVVPYLVAQLVGGALVVSLVVGLPYRAALALVTVGMVGLLVLGGMRAVTLVQVVKALLLLAAAALLVGLAVARFGFDPLALLSGAAARGGGGDTGRHASEIAGLDGWNGVSIGLALMFGTAGLPQVLMRFSTVPTPRTARASAGWATLVVGCLFALACTIGFSATALVGPRSIEAADRGGNLAMPLLAERVGGAPLTGVVAAIAFATVLAVVAGLTLAGAATLSHDLWFGVVRRRPASSRAQLRIARLAAVALSAAAAAIAVAFEGRNLAFLVGLAFAIAASANFPALLLTICWPRFGSAGASATILTGATSALVLIVLSPTVLDGAVFPLVSPAIVSMPLAFAAGIAATVLTRRGGDRRA